MILFFLALLTRLPPIDTKIPSGSFSYPGKHPREIIVVEPEKSPLLQEACQKIESAVERAILQRTLCFVREKLFDTSKCTQPQIQSLVAEFGRGEIEPEIPLDTFLKEQSGVCRHIALTTTFLIEHLIAKGILKGEVLLIREDTPFGRHAWTLFLGNESAWHIDAYWDVLEDGKTVAGFSRLCKKYGNRVMQQQKQNWENDES